MFERLQADKILATVRRLHARILQHFPEAGLTQVAAEFASLAEASPERIALLYRRNLALRALIVVLLAAIVGVAALFMTTWFADREHSLEVARDVGGLIQAIESVLGAAFFLSAAIVSIVTLEKRHIRVRVVRAMQELRAMAHIVDLHQLQKDPELFVIERGPGEAREHAELSIGEMTRYLDFCTELLSLLGNVAVLYAQPSHDPTVHAAADDVQQLSGNLANKIWQKIMILDRIAERSGA